MIPRHLAATLEKAAQSYPVIYLSGPRQSGKTTLVRAIFSSHAYVSLEDPDERAFADEDPRGFLMRLADGAVIDEIQCVPKLLSYLQTEIRAGLRRG